MTAYDRFQIIAKRARSTKDADDVLALIGAYADNGCGMYEIDVELVESTFGQDAPKGFEFGRCPGWGGVGYSLTVQRIDV